MTDTAATAMLAFASLWLGLGALISLVYPLWRDASKKIHPQQRANILLAWLRIPLGIATLLTALLYWPPVALIESHCHGDSCAQHSPRGPLALLPGIVLGLLVLGRLGSSYWRQIKPAERLRRELASFAIDRDGFKEITSDKPAAFTLGWRSPTIYLSSGLLQHLGNEALQCILQHELCHQQRHDNLRLLLIGLACAPLPRAWVRTLLRDHSLACEQACDLAAAKNSSKEQVAETLLQVSRLQTASPAASCAFADSFTSQRVMALLDDTPPSLPQPALLLSTVLIASCSLLLINPLHVLLEHLVL
jgi:Zn-dependent protease with chaperone function